MFLLLALTANAWYLPGMAPTDFNEHDEVPVLVNRLTSMDSKFGDGGATSGLDYYSKHLRFCEPEGGKVSKGGSLGSVLFGDRIYTSPILPKMLENEECHVLCTSVYGATDAEFLANKMLRGYLQHWLVDGLPIEGINDQDEISFEGFLLGEVVSADESKFDEFVVYNHYELTLKYHYNQNAMSYRVVGASVRPRSIGNARTEAGEEYNCLPLDEQDVVLLRSDTLNEAKITYSYSVKWEESDTPWATRWDQYLKVKDPVVNWFALVNTTIMVYGLCFMSAMLMMRMLRKDIAHYNHIDLSSDDIPDESGWKLVAGDVFRPPRYPQLLAIATGTGVQLLCTFLSTITLAALGFLSPANRGSFTTSLLLLNTLLGGVGGYFSAVTYKLWGGQLWKTNLLFTPVVLPVIVFVLFFITNLLLVLNDASGAVPLGSIIVLILIWGGISVPLSWVCGFLGFKREVPFKPTIRVNQIPRQIPPPPKYMKPLYFFYSGPIPFLAVALQLRYILSAIWYQSIYYMFGFLFASVWAMVLLAIACSLMVLYFTLVAEDYRWQYRSFFVAGSPAVYVYLYSLYYMVSKLSLKSFTGVILYMTYTSLVSVLLFLALGSIGSICSYLLVWRIYKSIKMD